MFFHNNTSATPRWKTCAARRKGFSLVEVALALGVAAFALIILVGLVPGGITSAKESIEEGRAINVLSAVAADRRASPFGVLSEQYRLPVLTNTQASPLTGFFGTGDDNQKTAGLPNARFRIDYRITPPSSGQRGPFIGNFRASWPAMAASPQGSIEIVATFPQQ